MKISVRNLGVISEADIDLKPLTVFVGPNNAGKTWLAYTFAGIFSSHGWSEYMDDISGYTAKRFSAAYPSLDTAIEQIYNEGNAAIDLYEFADKYGEDYFNNIASFAKQWMHKYLSTNRVSFTNLEISIDLAERNQDFLERILQTPLRNEMSVGRRRLSPLLSLVKKEGERNLFIYTSTEEKDGEKLPREIVIDRLIRLIFLTLHRSLFPDVRILPTERTAFRQEQDTTTLIAAVRRYVTMMDDIFRISSLARIEREEQVKQSPAVQNYIELARLLEQEIMGGSINFSTPDLSPGREILFQSGEDFSLEISIASSMVKELVPLSLYLRYLAQPGELLIIDEPEMNLHPEAQVKLTEFLAMLVNAGLRVLVTTHSTYMVDHLINLMNAFKHEKKDEIIDLFFLQRPEAFIAQDNVSVYLIEHGKAQNILDENGIIHWDTFSNVTDRVERIHFQL